jgi:hypothetical protein
VLVEPIYVCHAITRSMIAATTAADPVYPE